MSFNYSNSLIQSVKINNWRERVCHTACINHHTKYIIYFFTFLSICTALRVRAYKIVILKVF